jgi:hypothetical protein
MTRKSETNSTAWLVVHPKRNESTSNNVPIYTTAKPICGKMMFRYFLITGANV